MTFLAKIIPVCQYFSSEYQQDSFFLSADQESHILCIPPLLKKIIIFRICNNPSFPPIGLVKLIPGQEKALFHNNAWSIL